MSIQNNDPIDFTVKRMELNLQKLRQIGPYGNPNSLWEAAGHIWKAVYWLCELTKDVKIKNYAWNVRQALGQIISHNQQNDDHDFEFAVNRITESYHKIQNRF